LPFEDLDEVEREAQQVFLGGAARSGLRFRRPRPRLGRRVGACESLIALLAAAGFAPADPPGRRPTATLAEARGLRCFTSPATTFAPTPEGGLRRQTPIGGAGGLGKSHVMGQYLPHVPLAGNRPFRHD